jgi:UPF0755 protein
MSRKRIVLLIIALGLAVVAFFTGQWFYKAMKKPLVVIDDDYAVFYIPTGSNFEYVAGRLYEQNIIEDTVLFREFAELKKYINNIKPGRYKIEKGLTANELVNKLRSGDQWPVRLTFNNIRFLPKLAGIVGRTLEADSAVLMSLLTDPGFLKEYNLEPRTAISLFIPDTYEFFWNTSARGFVERMKREYDKFWNKERRAKAMEIGLKPLDVIILASIIQEETNKIDEMSRMAGVLINRLKRGMKLQADPTARFAYGDFSVKRIKTDYTKIESPYNTYYVTGLPPGPITMAEPRVIDAVLNYEHHNYLFYCAKADGSGYHVFAKTNAQHSRNARAYHRYLNRNRIR